MILHIGAASHELSFSSPSFSQISPGANSAPLPGHPNKVICERVRLQSLFPLLPSDQNTTVQEDAHFKAFFQVVLVLLFSASPSITTTFVMMTVTRVKIVQVPRDSASLIQSSIIHQHHQLPHHQCDHGR